MKVLQYFLALSIGLFVMSCVNPDDDIPVVGCNVDSFTSGLLVINEGPFGSGSGSLTAIDNQSGTISDAYTSNNCDSLLGNTVQSATVIGEQIAVVVNNANVVRLLNKSTLALEGTITGLQSPRYIVGGEGNLAYVSQWGSDGVSGSVVEVDLANQTVLRQVATGSGSEELKWNNGMLYVPNGGGFSKDSTLVIVDPSAMTVVETIVTGINPQSIAFEGDNVWVLNSGRVDFYDPNLNENGALTRINNNAVAESFELPAGSSNLAYDSSREQFYFGNSAGISSWNKNSMETSGLLSGSFYDLFLAPDEQTLYLCDAKDFATLGDLIALDITTLEQTRTTVGLIPGEVIAY